MYPACPLIRHRFHVTACLDQTDQDALRATSRLLPYHHPHGSGIVFPFVLCYTLPFPASVQLNLSRIALSLSMFILLEGVLASGAYVVIIHAMLICSKNVGV